MHHTDARGSITNLVGVKNGALFRAENNGYDAFGQQETDASAVQSTVQNEIKYTGAVEDEATGLYYLGSRHYDPNTGQFLQQDTYTGDPYSPWTQNLYVYTSNNPVNYVDPTGHSFIGTLVGLLIAGAAFMLGGCGRSTIGAHVSDQRPEKDPEVKKLVTEGINTVRGKTRENGRENGVIVYKDKSGQYRSMEVEGEDTTVEWDKPLDQLRKEGNTDFILIHSHPETEQYLYMNAQITKSLSSNVDYNTVIQQGRDSRPVIRLYTVTGDYEEAIEASAIIQNNVVMEKANADSLSYRNYKEEGGRFVLRK